MIGYKLKAIDRMSYARIWRAGSELGATETLVAAAIDGAEHP
jgi:hypothetical protein